MSRCRGYLPVNLMGKSMNATVAPQSFRYLAIAALVWNLIGVATFVVQIGLTPEELAALPAKQREVYAATPLWITIAYAIAVFGGTFGALGLLLKKRWATHLFLLSLLALLVQTLGAYAVTPVWQVFGPAGLVMPMLLVVIAVALLLYARGATARGWLG